jgi:hypothetical protein
MEGIGLEQIEALVCQFLHLSRKLPIISPEAG